MLTAEVDRLAADSHSKLGDPALDAIMRKWPNESAISQETLDDLMALSAGRRLRVLRACNAAVKAACPQPEYRGGVPVLPKPCDYSSSRSELETFFNLLRPLSTLDLNEVVRGNLLGD
jgi:hypothetical protein